MYAKWERGATVPDVDKTALLAKVYGVSLDSILKTETVEGFPAEFFESKIQEIMEKLSGK